MYSSLLLLLSLAAVVSSHHMAMETHQKKVIINFLYNVMLNFHIMVALIP